MNNASFSAYLDLIQNYFQNRTCLNRNVSRTDCITETINAGDVYGPHSNVNAKMIGAMLQVRNVNYMIVANW